MIVYGDEGIEIESMRRTQGGIQGLFQLSKEGKPEGIDAAEFLVGIVKELMKLTGVEVEEQHEEQKELEMLKMSRCHQTQSRIFPASTDLPDRVWRARL